MLVDRRPQFIKISLHEPRNFIYKNLSHAIIFSFTVDVTAALVFLISLYTHTLVYAHTNTLSVVRAVSSRKYKLVFSGADYLRKSADHKAHISPVSGPNASLTCALRSADFLRQCTSP